MALQIPNCVAIDTETTGLSPWHGDHIFSAAAAFPNGRRLFWYKDFSGLQDILGDPSIDKVFHNAKFDLHMLKKLGMTVRGKVWDTMIFCHLLNSRDGISLADVTERYLPNDRKKVIEPINTWMDQHDIPKNKRGEHFADLPRDIIKARNIGDTDLTLRLFNRVYSTVSRTFPFLLNQEHALLPVVQRMEERGICVDLEEIDKQVDVFTDIIEYVQSYCEGAVGRDTFNLNSYKDQHDLLEPAGLIDVVLSLPSGMGKTPTGRAKFNDYNLRLLHHPSAHMLLLGKAAGKMRDTFLEQLRRLNVHGVLHPNFNQLGTTTGRFSCSYPNLQNIPIEGNRRTSYTEDEAEEAFEMTGIEYAPHIKRCFVCRPGFAHIHSDKKQAEMVMLAHYSDDKVMKAIFETGESIHDGICKAVYGEWTKGLKTRTKAIVFGYQYGASLRVMAMKAGTDEAEARITRDKLSRVLTGLPRFKRMLGEELNERGFLTTIHGRRHYLNSDEVYMGVNRVCQGSVGDEIKSRMVAIDAWAQAESPQTQILLNIHDDIGTETPIEDLPKSLPNVARIMGETSKEYRLPLPSSLDVTTTRWSDLKEVDDVDAFLKQLRAVPSLRGPKHRQLRVRNTKVG